MSVNKNSGCTLYIYQTIIGKLLKCLLQAISLADESILIFWTMIVRNSWHFLPSK